MVLLGRNINGKLNVGTLMEKSDDGIKKAFAFRVFLLSDMAVGMVMRPQIYPKAL